MNKTRVMPVLLLRGQGLVKTVKFKEPKYIGDPLNSVRIFNEKEVDELVFLDISATPLGRGPNFSVLADIAQEAFMPMAYGGGLSSMEQVRKVFSLGFEKIVLDTVTYKNPELVREVVSVYGAQAVTACIDVRRTLLGRYALFTHSGGQKQSVELLSHLDQLSKLGVGEIMVNSIDRDGTMSGYDLKLLQTVSRAVSVPVVACGGAGSLSHLAQAVHEGGASAVAAGSLFVFLGPHRAVLINYPPRQQLTALLP